MNHDRDGLVNLWWSNRISQIVLVNGDDVSAESRFDHGYYYGDG